MTIKRIVPGKGCEVQLILAEKTALWDTGMFYCADECVRLVKESLNGATLDYIVLSHSHYDHVGGLSIFRAAFPKAQVLASDYCAYVFTRDSAKALMKEMSENAATVFGVDQSSLPPFDISGFYVDRTVGTGDILDLGSVCWDIYNTPGHTKDCLSLFEKESRTLIISESCGIAEDHGWVHVPVLTGCQDCLNDLALCESLDARVVICPHHGLVTEDDGYKTPTAFFRRGRECLYIMMNMVRDCFLSGMDDDQIVQYLVENVHDRYIITEGQPIKAFTINTEAYLRLLHKEHPELFQIE